MKILVAVDGSTSALGTTEYAAQFLAVVLGNSKITLISAHDDTAFKHMKKFTSKGVFADYLRVLSEKDLQAAR